MLFIGLSDRLVTPVLYTNFIFCGRSAIDHKRLAITVSLMESYADGAYECDVHYKGSELSYSVSYSGRSADNDELEDL